MKVVDVPISQKSYLSIKEAKAFYGFGINQTREKAKKAGATLKVGRRILISRAAFDQYLDSCNEGAKR